MDYLHLKHRSGFNRTPTKKIDGGTEDGPAGYKFGRREIGSSIFFTFLYKKRHFLGNLPLTSYLGKLYYNMFHPAFASSGNLP